jgi:predicted Zn-dependent protease
MVGSDRPKDLFRLLNGLAAGQALSVGSSVKIITDQP